MFRKILTISHKSETTINTRSTFLYLAVTPSSVSDFENFQKNFELEE